MKVTQPPTSNPGGAAHGAGGVGARCPPAGRRRHAVRGLRLRRRGACATIRAIRGDNFSRDKGPGLGGQNQAVPGAFSGEGYAMRLEITGPRFGSSSGKRIIVYGEGGSGITPDDATAGGAGPELDAAPARAVLRAGGPRGPPSRLSTRSSFPTVNWLCMAILYRRAQRLTAQNADSRPGQSGKVSRLRRAQPWAAASFVHRPVYLLRDSL
jgi:hypothetical protein